MPLNDFHHVTSDDVELVGRCTKKDDSPSRPTIVLIHGWSGSSRYFDPAMETLELVEANLLTYDQRGHGDSASPRGRGCTVARLAMDLREILDADAVSGTQSTKGYILVGCSMGSAVIWSYLQLWGDDERIAGTVFVDQAPLQNRRPGWTCGSLGCYDAETYENLARAVRSDMSAFADGNAACCIHEPEKMDPQVLLMLKNETLKCDPEALCELMYDHTHQDWRSVCRTTAVPSVILYGEKSQIFPREGFRALEELLGGVSPIRKGRSTCFQKCGHWLYLEDVEGFVRCLKDAVVEFQHLYTA
jgi:pimeloyl-ACP methyl ester carboxylesterase